MCAEKAYITNSDFSYEDKDFLLHFIVSYKAGLDFVEENKDLFDDSNARYSTDSWWKRWGKCVAGTVGGAVTGGLGGALGGSAVPVIGTVAGGVAGAVGGGLTGAAGFCDDAFDIKVTKPDFTANSSNIIRNFEVDITKLRYEPVPKYLVK